MPLARLTIKTAVQIAHRSVTIKKEPTGVWWRVVVRHGAARVEHRTATKVGAKAKRRERRIFLALILLGFEKAEATGLAEASIGRAEWRKVVAAHVERRILCG